MCFDRDDLDNDVIIEGATDRIGLGLIGLIVISRGLNK